MNYTIKNHLRLILGSESDFPNANIVLAELHKRGVHCGVSVASCHWHSGTDDFINFLKNIPESIIAFLGGMSLQAPAIIEAILKNIQKPSLVIGIPTDAAARSALEDLPALTGILTTGLNTVSVSHSLKSAGATIAKLVAFTFDDNEIWEKIAKIHRETRDGDKRIRLDIDLENGLIPAKIK